jgi:hypothetical protein
MGSEAFATRFKPLFNICESTEVTVHVVMSSNFYCLNFRRTLTGEVLRMWIQMRDLCHGVNLSPDTKDTFVWGLDRLFSQILVQDAEVEHAGFSIKKTLEI